MSPPPLRVVHIASGDRWAGAEAQLFILVTHLASEQALDVSVILLNDGELALRLRREGIAVTVVDETRYGFRSLLRQITKLLRADRPGLIHTHRQKENILGALAGWRLGIPSLRTVHGSQEIAPRGLAQIRHLLINNTDRWLGRHVQRRLIAVAADLHDKLVNEYPAGKILTIENGIDMAIAQQAGKPQLPPLFTPPEARHIGIAGRLDAVKRIDLFLDAAAELVRRGTHDCRFHVLGEGKLRAQLEAHARHLGLRDRVKFHGHRSDILECLAALDALVMCSDHEGLPMVAMESIAVGTPVVAHAVGGLVPLLEGGCGGLLDEHHSAMGYADAIEQVLANDNTDMMARGLARIESDYSASRNAARTAALYREIQSRSG